MSNATTSNGSHSKTSNQQLIRLAETLDLLSHEKEQLFSLIKENETELLGGLNAYNDTEEQRFYIKGYLKGISSMNEPIRKMKKIVDDKTRSIDKMTGKNVSKWRLALILLSVVCIHFGLYYFLLEDFDETIVRCWMAVHLAINLCHFTLREYAYIN
eukprot:TRINITY_DN17796_c0_g1_i1.p1 TRINITY_DN17796_c0_g1~~TRINITY_DN17796_c0_g1_i1.p1  ORF type:complete len:157 (+),score=27.96 TRINITY_DN17796_c0_g1_i1:251-721(+)